MIEFLLTHWYWGLAWVLVMSVVAFVMMGVDKWKAKRGKWRISEASLFLVAILGGAIGSILGMRHFRHKTKHPQFKYGLPAILILQICILVGGGLWFWLG